MVEKIRAFSQSEAMQTYKAIIGTLVFIAVTFIGWSVNRMLDQNQKMYEMIQEQAKVDIVMQYDINYNKKDIKEIKSCVRKNTNEINKIKVGM
jgi:hypothetical protein